MPTPPNIDDAKQVATDWHALIDARDGEGSWRVASTVFQGAITSEDWTAKIVDVLNTLGPLTSRQLAVEQRLDTIPGSPPGDYVLLQYHSVFDQTKAVVETITLILEDDAWRVIGHFVR